MQTYRKRFSNLDTNELYEILKLRFDVFVLEQECLYSEIDNLDQDAIHVYIKDGEEILAYLRVLDRGVESEDVAIGRVIAKNRRQGLGTLVLEEGIKAGKEFFDAERIYLEAKAMPKTFTKI